MRNTQSGASAVGCIMAVVVAVAATLLIIYKPWEGTPSSDTHTPATGEQYFVDRQLTGYGSNYQPQYKDTYMQLTTVARWEKDSQPPPTTWTNPLSGSTCRDWVIQLHINQPQSVINWYYKPRASSPLDPPNYNPAFSLVVWDKPSFDRYFPTPDRGLTAFRLATEADKRGPSNKGVYCVVVHEAGDYVIVITPSAVQDIVDWWVKVGAQ